MFYLQKGVTYYFLFAYHANRSVRISRCRFIKIHVSLLIIKKIKSRQLFLKTRTQLSSLNRSMYH